MVMKKGKKRGSATRNYSAAKPKVSKGKKVKFMLHAPDAGKVMLAGDFNNWQHARTPLKKGKKAWEKDLVLKPGKYEYKFVVDGNWINDPGNDCYIWNSYGTQNSVIEI